MKKIEQKRVVEGKAGKLEALYYPQENSVDVAVICHPHPLHQGTMHNKVITTLIKTFYQANMSSIRFNYRGVGASQGIYDHGVGEIDDCLAVTRWIQQEMNAPKIWLVGFSFGAYIAAKAASILQPEAVQLITVAPALGHADFNNIEVRCPWLVIHGTEDELISLDLVEAWYAQLHANKSLIKLEGAQHFFHGKLIELQKRLGDHFGF